jgi:NAD(P)-dependent dehydrogenase (short-subunit alcohol dehydrogenase family)
MDLGIRGKRAFVSGSSSGIGRAIALELAAEGCDIAVHGRNKARTEETAHAAEALGVKAVVTLGDLATMEGCDKAAAEALAGFGSVEIVINNAGIALRKDNPVWSEVPDQTWVDSFQVNFMSALRMSKAFLPCVIEAGWGRFIQISTGGSRTAGILSEYGAVKAAMNKLTADIAKTVGKHGATSNGIMPGLIMTPAIEEYLGVLAGQMGWEGDLAELERNWLQIMPQSVQRVGRPRDIAAMTAFLCSPLAGYMTGVTFAINGGQGNFV